jgi:lipopolysaccharide/colanic/teichoic acid biosynthesis glycosyltransferase
MSPFQEIIKRGFDIAFAIAGLLLLSPLKLLISLGIKSESPGPIVCRHKRYGLNNAAFEVFAFRTTLAGQEEKGLILPGCRLAGSAQQRSLNRKASHLNTGIPS